ARGGPERGLHHRQRAPLHDQRDRQGGGGSPARAAAAAARAAAPGVPRGGALRGRLSYAGVVVSAVVPAARRVLPDEPVVRYRQGEAPAGLRAQVRPEARHRGDRQELRSAGTHLTSEAPAKTRSSRNRPGSPRRRASRNAYQSMRLAATSSPPSSTIPRKPASQLLSSATMCAASANTPQSTRSATSSSMSRETFRKRCGPRR